MSKVKVDKAAFDASVIDCEKLPKLTSTVLVSPRWLPPRSKESE